jgi:hypothetical protein
MLIVIAVLAVAQGIVGVLRALQWIHIGSDLVGHGVLLLPIVGLLALARGTLIAVLAILYITFAWGAIRHRRWASAIGLAAALLNGFAVANFLIVGEPAAQALPWAIVPVVLVLYVLSPAGHRALSSVSPTPKVR